ncbi:hypothetical protein AKJ65_05425, partial [candidate division MSBL1 archaeon SCGC-AAA259E19]
FGQSPKGVAPPLQPPIIQIQVHLKRISVELNFYLGSLRPLKFFGRGQYFPKCEFFEKTP